MVALEVALISAMNPAMNPTPRPAWRQLYPGPLLPGSDAPVVAARRRALHRRVQQALTVFGESLPDL